MSGTLYEFTPQDSPPPTRKWVVAVMLVPAVAAAVVAVGWGIVHMEQKRAEALSRKSFRLTVDLRNRVIVAVAQTRNLRGVNLGFLAEHPHLQMINLSETESGDLQTLPPLDDLRVLDLRDCAWVDDEQAARLGDLKDLKRLDLSGTRITDAGLSAIRDLPQLSDLGLERCRGISDAGLEICARMKQLRELWVGGAGYTTDGLIALRERRRDLNLQLQPVDLVSLNSRRAESTKSSVSIPEIVYQPGQAQGVKATLSTAADIEALSDLLRFKQTWRYWRFQDQTKRRTVPSAHLSNYREHIEDSWTSLRLQGPAAGQAPAKLLPLTHELAELRLQETTMATEEFPFDGVPADLHRLHLDNVDVSESFLQQLREQTNVKQVKLWQARVDDVDVDHAVLGQFPTTLQSAGVLDTTDPGSDEPTWTSLELAGEPTGRSLQKLLPLVPRLEVLELRHAVDAEHFPFDLLPPSLQRLHIGNAQVSDSFLRALGRRISLEHLVLFRVDLVDVDLSDPALGQLTTLDSMRLASIKINGVDLADPARDSFRALLKEQHPRTRTVILSDSPDSKPIEWGNPAEESGRPSDRSTLLRSRRGE